MFMPRTSLILISTALLAAPALANDFEDLALLDQRVADMAASVQASAEPIDRRIKLRRCPETALLETVPGMIAIRCAPLGWRLRVALQGGTAAAKVEMPIIRRGEAVNVMIVGDDYSVSYDGTAMDDGGVGKSIRVKFSTQGAFLTATVTAPGKVQIKD
jgi:flagellar basal body P-ring formation protein FlgA